MTSSTVKFVTVVVCISVVFAADEYITEVQKSCKAKSDFYSCGKYEVAKYISKKIAGDPTMVIDGVVKFVTMEQPDTTASLFPAARQMPGDSEFMKFVKFLQRQTDVFLGSRALSISLPDRVKIVDPEEPNNELVPAEGKVESRKKKKKVAAAAILIPLIILVKLFKVKILVAAVLLVVLVIKKALFVLLLLAPSYLHSLKICKEPHYQHVEEHEIGGTGYGFDHTAHAHHGGYGKDWGNDRAYSAYRPG